MSAEHVPGPWNAIEIPNGWVIQRSEGRGTDYIADVHGHVGDPPCDAANAALVAAAPELLAALTDLLVVTRRSGNVSDDELAALDARYGERLTWSEIVDAVHEAAHAAIAKTGGR